MKAKRLDLAQTRSRLRAVLKASDAADYLVVVNGEEGAFLLGDGNLNAIAFALRTTIEEGNEALLQMLEAVISESTNKCSCCGEPLQPVN